MKTLLIFVVWLCFWPVTVQSEPFFSISQLSSMKTEDLYDAIVGNYRSSLIQMGWSSPSPFEQYYMKIDNQKVVWIFHKDISNPTTMDLMYKFSFELKNDNGILTAKTSLLSEANNQLMDLNKGWLNGMFYISTGYSKVMFGNHIEIDGGPATTWIRTNEKF